MRGVSRERLEDFLRDLHVEFDWDIILLQELTKARRIAVLPSGVNGHLVRADAPISGVRVPGIVIHDEQAEYAVEEAIVRPGVAAQLLDHPILGKLFLVTAHLDATTSREA